MRLVYAGWESLKFRGLSRGNLGLGHGALQRLISATFGNPSEARDLMGGPSHALMPRAHRGRFEPFDHFVLGHLLILAMLAIANRARFMISFEEQHAEKIPPA